MASEITVTFEDGGIFNGYASSYTKDNTTTYYFEIDKKYRVQVLNSGETITLQQYKNTNGSWYNINIIKSVAITPISGGGGGDVTIEYLQKNYYTKTETNEKYVKKSGDTMTGNLIFDYNNYTLTLTSNGLIIFDKSANKKLLELFKNYFNTTNGGFYIYNDNSNTLAYLAKEGDKAALHLFYDSRIVVHSGAPGTTESYLNIKYGTITEYNNDLPLTFNSSVLFNYRVDLMSWMYIRTKDDGAVTGIIQNNGNIAMYNGHGFYSTPYNYGEDNPEWVKLSNTTFSGTAITFANKVVNQDTITSYSTLSVNPSSGSEGNTVISAGNIIVYSSLNNVNDQRAEINGGGFYHRYNYSGTFMWLRYDYQRYVNSGKTKAEMAAGGIHFYYGAGVTYHSGASGVTEQYTKMNNSGITLYNTTGGTFTINTNGNALTLQSLMGNGATAFRINVPGAHYSLTEGSGTVTGTGIYKAINEGFYSESMLSALNLFLTYLQNNIKSAVTTFNKVSIIDFNPFDLGDGTKGRGGRIGG